MRMHDLLDAGITIITVFAVFVGFTKLMEFARSSLRYQLDESGLSFVGALWGPKPIPYWDIESARVISWLDWLLDWGEFNIFKARDYTTRTFPAKIVVVRRRDGKIFMLTPDNPEAFVCTINERIAGTAPPKLPGPVVGGEPPWRNRVDVHMTQQ